jgi:hypothetical protein
MTFEKEFINMTSPVPPPTSKDRAIYQLKVNLMGSRPPIWRRLQVRGDTTLAELHSVLQTAMGWTNSHLHQFVVRNVAYADPHFKLEHAQSTRQITVSRVAPRVGASFVYEYDFGDGWTHKITVEKILPPGEAALPHPVCLTGKRACPPEDCGGVGGYENFLEAIADPNHPEHEDMVDWIGDDFDPEAFDLEAVNHALSGRRLR